MGFGLIPIMISKIGLVQLFQLLSTANLLTTLSDRQQSFTVFAPTDEAIQRFLDSQTTEVSTEALTNLLLNHVVAGSVFSRDLSVGQTVSTVGGAQLQVGQSADGGLTIGGAPITGPIDVRARNGVIHVIGEVITASGSAPQTDNRSAANGNLPQVITRLGLSQLVDLVTSANLVSTLSDEGQKFTVFAPTNAAIAKFLASQPKEVVDSITSGGEALTNLLLNHVVAGEIMSSDAKPGVKVTAVGGDELEITQSGNGLRIGGARLSSMLDKKASNGVVHVIDDVIYKSDMNLPEVISGLGLNQLVQLVTSANLVGTLADESQTFTVFAPTDDAIARFLASQPADVVASITSGGEALTNLLLNHVVPGKILSSDAQPGVKVTAVGGDELEVRRSMRGLTIGGARLSSQLDVPASNGVVHVINDVIYQ